MDVLAICLKRPLIKWTDFRRCRIVAIINHSKWPPDCEHFGILVWIDLLLWTCFSIGSNIGIVSRMFIYLRIESFRMKYAHYLAWKSFSFVRLTHKTPFVWNSRSATLRTLKNYLWEVIMRGIWLTFSNLSITGDDGVQNKWCLSSPRKSNTVKWQSCFTWTHLSHGNLLKVIESCSKFSYVSTWSFFVGIKTSIQSVEKRLRWRVDALRVIISVWNFNSERN